MPLLKKTSGSRGIVIPDQGKYKGNHMQAQRSKTAEKNKAKGKYQKAAGGDKT